LNFDKAHFRRFGSSYVLSVARVDTQHLVDEFLEFIAEHDSTDRIEKKVTGEAGPVKDEEEINCVLFYACVIDALLSRQIDVDVEKVQRHVENEKADGDDH
jgi:hypothetical protein